MSAITIIVENACPAGNAGCANSPWATVGTPGMRDFFTPARSPLAAAPWVFVRGNHESCNRAGQGWWRLLDFRSRVAGHDCNIASDDERGDYSEPYAVPISGDTQFVVFDSSRVGVNALVPSDPMYRNYAAELGTAVCVVARRCAQSVREPSSDPRLRTRHHAPCTGGLPRQ